MGQKFSKKNQKKKDSFDEEKEKEKEKEAKIEEEIRIDYENKMKEYNDYCSQFNFYTDKIITVELNELFAVKGYLKTGCPPHARKKENKFVRTDEKIQFIEEKAFSLSKLYTYGGGRNIVFAFKAIKKGKSKIIFSNYIVDVTIV